MSRIGKKPVEITAGVTVSVNGNKVEVKGPKGTLNFDIKEPITATVEGSTLTVNRPDDSSTNKALHGLTRSLIANMVEGVSKGFQKKLLLNGVGYRAALQGSKLTLQLGFSHPIELNAPDGISFEVSKTQTEIIVRGVDKVLVGQVAANIRKFRVTEPYKGKGIRYDGEQIRRKAGKAAATAAK